MPHYLRYDRRIEVVRQLIKPFQVQLEKVQASIERIGIEYWDSIYADETEHFVGTVFIVLQNYINSSISDLYPDMVRLHLKYLIGQKVNNSRTSKIQLIISIANFYKHRDLPSELHKNTSDILTDLNIEYKHIYNEQDGRYFHEVGSNSPVYTGFTILSETWKFNDLIEIVSEWRENMWQMEEK